MKSASVSPPLVQMRALLVEDNLMNAELARTLLELAGHQVRVVTTGAAFREAVAKGPPPDIVLMDILLPDANGAALLAALRAAGQWAAVPVVALTAQALTGD
ncbi:MAG: response regulator [Myxococcales bacterium]